MVHSKDFFPKGKNHIFLNHGTLTSFSFRQQWLSRVWIWWDWFPFFWQFDDFDEVYNRLLRKNNSLSTESYCKLKFKNKTFGIYLKYFRMWRSFRAWREISKRRFYFRSYFRSGNAALPVFPALAFSIFEEVKEEDLYEAISNRNYGAAYQRLKQGETASQQHKYGWTPLILGTMIKKLILFNFDF